MAEVVLPGARGDLPVFVAEPSPLGDSHAGVLVVSDALGMTSDLRSHAEWLASLGYVAAAPDLFASGGHLRCLFSTMRQALARDGPVFDDLETTRGWLLDHPAASGRVGVIGFCLGGGMAVMLAGSGRYDVSSVNYGDVPKDALDLLADACPVVGSFGGRDVTLRKAPDRLATVLAEVGVEHDIHVYPDAGHSFLNDHAPAEVPRWAVVMGALSRSKYHEPSARHARDRIAAFFATHLVSAGD